MSYLNLAKGIPDFAKAVISLWFRVPTESVAAAAARTSNLLFRTIPLITFGEPQTSTIYDPVVSDIAVWHYTPADGTSPIMQLSNYVASGEEPVDPCLIGIDCSDGTARLVFNIQLSTRAPLVSAGWVANKVDIYQLVPGITFEPGNGNVGIGPSAYGVYKIKDVSYIRTAQPESFYVRTEQIIGADQWHHVLLSFDLSASCSVGQPNPSSSCKLWFAVDDIDYRGQENLQPYRYENDGLGPNDIVTANIARVSGGKPGPGLFFNQWVPAASGAYQPGSIPTSEFEIGLPASTKYVDGILRVEMAEFQMWTGVTLDTGIAGNRRAFVDEDGKPVDPTGTGNDPRGPAERLLGKKPEILLHGSSDWQEGYNTGTLGINIETIIDGEQTITKITKLPSGQFKPVAGIEQYKPEPSLAETTA